MISTSRFPVRWACPTSWRWGQQCKARVETLKQDIVDANAKEEGDDEAVEMLRDTLNKSREKYCKMVEKEMV